jgi:hypothetical protein
MPAGNILDDYRDTFGEQDPTPPPTIPPIPPPPPPNPPGPGGTEGGQQGNQNQQNQQNQQQNVYTPPNTQNTGGYYEQYGQQDVLGTDLQSALGDQ